MIELTSAQWRALASCTTDDGYHSFVLSNGQSVYAGVHDLIARVTDLTWDGSIGQQFALASKGDHVIAEMHGYSPRQSATAITTLDHVSQESFERNQLRRVVDTCGWLDRLTASGELGCTVHPGTLAKALKVVEKFATIELCNICFKATCVVLDAQDAKGYRRVTCYVQGVPQDD